MVVALQLPRNGFPQRGDSVEAGVDVVALANGPDRALGDCGWNLGIAYPLRQVHAAHPVAFHSHGADFGLLEMWSDLAEAKVCDCGSHKNYVYHDGDAARLHRIMAS